MEPDEQIVGTLPRNERVMSKLQHVRAATSTCMPRWPVRGSWLSPLIWIVETVPLVSVLTPLGSVFPVLPFLPVPPLQPVPPRFQARWSTRWTAAAIRSQFAVSSTSCLRPVFVSR